MTRQQYLSQRIEQLQQALLAAEPGVVNVRLRDGSSVTYSGLAEADKELRRLQAELVRLQNGNMRPVDLGGR